MMFSSSGGLVTFILLGYLSFTEGLWWGSGGWSLQVPTNCPHVNNVTHVCSTLISENGTCYTTRCCDGSFGYNDDDSSSDDDHRSKRRAGGLHGGCRMCWKAQACSVYKCEQRCCDGYLRDYWGRCIEKTGGLQCENGGTLRLSTWWQYCDCPEGFQGKSCEIPICRCENGGECGVRAGHPFCNCPFGYYGDKCENANCTLPCYNGGLCYKSDEDEFCKCPQEYIGKQCEKSYVHPETCPPPEYSEDMCEILCMENENCESDHVCCKEGCSTVCREPRAQYCMYKDARYPIGATLNPDSCTNCTCKPAGSFVCSSVTCGQPQCPHSLQPVTKPGHCCPSCPDPDPPSLSNCPSTTVYVNTAYNMDLAQINETSLAISALDFQGNRLKVSYRPEFIRHCRCSLTADREVSVQAYALDQVGNIATCSFKVAVTDLQKPRFLYCPGDMEVTDTDTVTWREPLVEDNVGVMSTDTPSGNGRQLSIGKHSFLYTISDFDGNKATCSFTVTVVKAKPDPPEFRNCPTDVVYLNASIDSSRAVLNGYTVPLEAYDAAGERLQVTYHPVYIDHCKCLRPSTSAVVATSTDQHGSEVTCTFKVIVRDVTAPTFITCPRDVYVTEGNAVVWMDPTYKDNVGISGTSGWNQKSGDLFPVGNHTAVYKVWDFDGNTAICDFKIYVSEEEPRPPNMIGCPLTGHVIKLYTDKNSNSVLLGETKTSIEAYDHERHKLPVVYDPPTVSHCRCFESQITRTTVKATARDINGNEATCRFTVTVQDTEMPVFRYCPTDVEVEEGSVIGPPPPIPADNVGIADMSTSRGTTGTVLPVGIHVIEYKAWDYDYNTVLCSFNITVKEEKCDLECLNGGVCEKADKQQYCKCPQNFVGGLCQVKYDHPDACPAPEFSSDTCQTFCTSDRDCGADRICCKEGCSTVCREPRKIYCQIDGRELAVGDQYSPDLCTNCTCGSRGTIGCATQSCGFPKCSDGRQPVSVPGQCCLSCPVRPSPPPLTLSNCPARLIHLSTNKDTDFAVITAENTNIQASDSHGRPLEVYFKPAFVRHCACYDSLLQQQQVNAYAADEDGNVAMCSFNVIVRDPQAPRFVMCPDDIYVFDDEVVTWKEPDAVDNVKVAEKQCSSDRNGEMFAVGNYSVKYTAWDYDGNIATCFFQISVSPRGKKLEELPQGLRERSLGEKSARLEAILPPIFGIALVGLAALLLLYCCRRNIKSRFGLKTVTKDKKIPSYSDSIYAVPKETDSVKPNQKQKNSLVDTRGQSMHLTPDALAYHNAVYARPLSVIVDPPPYSLHPYQPPPYSVSGSVTPRSLKDVAYVTLPGAGYVNPGYETLSVHRYAGSSRSFKPCSTKSSKSGSVTTSRSTSSRRSSQSSKSYKA